jgi:NADH dehydrogenase (ubiquinone) 1 alpha subcomplex subunit 4
MAGGAEAKNKMIEFPMMKQIKGNYSLLPIVLIVGFGMGLSVFAMGRNLLRSPDVSINRRGNPKPYERLVNQDGSAVQYKYFSTLDYSKIQSDRPKLD